MRASSIESWKPRAKVAKEQGYDLVLDSSGNTNTGVPFVLYQKESPDLTDDVKAALQDATAGTAPPNPQP